MGNLYNFSSECLPLHDMKKALGSTIFVETGCFVGMSLRYALSLGFDHCYSCDIDKEMIAATENNLSPYADKFTIYESSSVDFLDQLLPTLANHSSIIFYLDAHLPGWDKGAVKEIIVTELSFPLEKELAIINKHRPKANDVIICDDLRIYEDGDFAGGNWRERQQYNIPSDFINNYNVTRCYSSEGYMVLTNK